MKTNFILLVIRKRNTQKFKTFVFFSFLLQTNVVFLLDIEFSLGFCLFLRYSDVDAFDCQRFPSGCPDADYFTDEIYKCKWFSL